ncbi:MAG TPA: DeoR/GlpR transcriptional regulator, partial [Clostridiales bacterium]|nr:DeoR/GlpR transcriptional regulator [Clostridiales bacterium]
MFVIDRQKSVLDYLRVNHTASVTELSRKFFVSETTIRRDLTKLEKSGYLTKTYGGAVLAEGHN